MIYLYIIPLFGRLFTIISQIETMATGIHGKKKPDVCFFLP